MGHAVPASDACYNCATPLSGAYCAACGQKALPLNPGLHDFLHDFTDEMLHVDGKIFQSTRKLLTAPGFLTREQFEGRRARWISPIRLYLIFSLAYFAMTSLVPVSGVRVTIKSESDQETAEELRKLGFGSEQDLHVAARPEQMGAARHVPPRAAVCLARTSRVPPHRQELSAASLFRVARARRMVCRRRHRHRCTTGALAVGGAGGGRARAGVRSRLRGARVAQGV
ncbi:MAG: hypothetical protein DMF84_17260 [Acidobacteria bacterium]|nr:MAG: hypothetical protein DMF84_17260 [Acidobacteriota bacterium]